MPRCAATYLNSIDLHSGHDMAVMARWWRWHGVAMYTNRRSCLNATISESMCSSKSRLRTGFLLAVCQPFFFQFGIHAVTDFIYGRKHTHLKHIHSMKWKDSTLPTLFTNRILAVAIHDDPLHSHGLKHLRQRWQIMVIAYGGVGGVVVRVW